MPRELILVPPSRQLLPDAAPINGAYPRDYTPADMRAWAQDLDHLLRAMEADRTAPPPQRQLERWLATDRAQLPPDAQRAVANYGKLMAEPDRGIKGDLREDGSIELTGGRHRAHYIMERGSTPVPVWVSARDQEQLNRFREACRAG